MLILTLHEQISINYLTGAVLIAAGAQHSQDIA